MKLLLLKEFRHHEKDMYVGKITHKKVWDKIAETMKAKGYIVTGRQCSTRFNTMKRTYKGIKDHNNKSGNNKRTWRYYEIMDNFLGTKPYMSHISTMSSTGSEISNIYNSNSNSSNSSISCISDVDDSNISRKRKKTDLASAIVESHAIAEDRKDKRHKEKMELKLKLMEKLDKILEKI
ncbi:uncharacterized protein LOC116847545 [Odontomachus brunneus]|uniref:uncharacterized protein LOC116847545 n=1 Tax=Odontomachus brunneus TaxID=486640 RepID=UPI0013F19A97|nr:uncharacterized protein LOC116847545 [Odontomachus brunneus]